MAIREILQDGDLRLKAGNKLVTDITNPQILDVIADLIDTMHANDLIGIAAPQIGENVRIFVTEPRETSARSKDQSDELRVYINPSIVDESEERIVIWEGCGCVDRINLFGPVMRPKTVTVEAIDQHGKKFRLTADGILGRVMQHEQDHLEGVEFIDLIFDKSLLLSRAEYIATVKPLPETIVNAHINIKEYQLLS